MISSRHLSKLDRGLLGLLLIVTFLKGAIWTALIPLWQAPDEYTHFSPVQFIAEHGRLPRKNEFRMSQELCQSVKWLETHNVAFRPTKRQSLVEQPPHPIRDQLANVPMYERWTTSETGCSSAAMFLPPLYYLIGAGIYRLVYTADFFVRTFAIRLLSVVLTTITVLFAWLSTREVFPSNRALHITVPVAVAFHPMITFLGAVINTDSLLFCLSSIIIFLSIRIATTGLTLKRAIVTGIALGLGILSKPHIFAITPALGTAILIAGWWRRREWHRWLLLVGIISLTALLIGGWSIYRSIQLNDSPFYASPESDIWGTSPNPNFKLTVVDYLSAYEQRLRTNLLESYWGIFGWLDTRLPGALYIFLRWATTLSIAGLTVYATRSAVAGRWNREQKGLLVSVIACLSIIGMLGVYGFIRTRAYGIFQPTQGRYLLNTISAQMLLLVLGLTEVVPIRLRPMAHVGLRVGFIGINIAALVFAILPRYYVLRGDPTSTIKGWAPVLNADGDQTAGFLLVPQQDDLSAITLWLNAEEGVEQAQVQMEETVPPGRRWVSEAIDVPGTEFPVRLSLPTMQEPMSFPLYLTVTSIGSQSQDVGIVATTSTRFTAPIGVEYRPKSIQGWVNNLLETWKFRFQQGETLVNRISQLKPSFFQGRALVVLLGITALGVGTLAVLLVLEAGSKDSGGQRFLIVVGVALGILFVLGGFEVKQSPEWINALLIDTTQTDTVSSTGVSYDLALAMTDATPVIEDPSDYVGLRWVEIGGKTNLAIWMHAPSAVTYQIQVPPRAQLTFDLALHPETWNSDRGDGVAFIVAVGTEKADTVVFWEAIDPKHNLEQRGWLSRSVDLSAYAEQVLYLRLQTQPLADNSWDWSMWGTPQIATGAGG